MTPRTGRAAAATEDLAHRLGIDATAVTVVSDEEVTWPDGSIGCPRPGLVYTQQLVEGAKIVLEAAGERFEYHAAGGGQPFLCPHPTPPLS